MAVFRYLSHPEIVVDPHTPVPEWSISDVGRTRVVDAMAEPWAVDITRVVSSAEVKARETAEIVAAHANVTVETRQASGEIDRSSTGYVPHDRHEELANELFGRPMDSAQGWERAIDAQTRIIDVLDDLMNSSESDAHVVVVGHGGVGTLLMCHVAEWDIDRRHDQPRGGCHWAYDPVAKSLLHAWVPLGAESAGDVAGVIRPE